MHAVASDVLALRSPSVGCPQLQAVEGAYDKEEALLAGLRRGEPRARRQLVDRYGTHLERVLVRALGPDPEIPDLLQDVYVAAFVGIGQFRGGKRQLRSWVARIAVFRARECIRRRSTRRALFPKVAHFTRACAPSAADPVAVEALRRTSGFLDRLPVEERVALSLRHIEGLELTEVAKAMEVSLATVKRRLSSGQRRILGMAEQDIVLKAWLER